MGAYIYRVTAKRVKCSDGEEANLAVYAYKPYGESFFDNGNRARNARAHFATGCVASERLADQGKLSNRIVLADSETFEIDADAVVYANVGGVATFYDDYELGNPDRFPRIDGITAIPPAKPFKPAKRSMY